MKNLQRSEIVFAFIDGSWNKAKYVEGLGHGKHTVIFEGEPRTIINDEIRVRIV